MIETGYIQFWFRWLTIPPSSYQLERRQQMYMIRAGMIETWQSRKDWSMAETGYIQFSVQMNHYTLVKACPRRNSVLIRKNVLRVMLEWQYSFGLHGNWIGIKNRESLAIVGGIMRPCRKTGLGQGQKANVLKKIEIRRLRLAFGCLWQTNAARTAKWTPPKKPCNCKACNEPE